MSERVLHQHVVVIRQLRDRCACFSRGRSPAIDDGGWRMFAIDEGAFEREVDGEARRVPFTLVIGILAQDSQRPQGRLK